MQRFRICGVFLFCLLTLPACGGGPAGAPSVTVSAILPHQTPTPTPTLTPSPILSPTPSPTPTATPTAPPTPQLVWSDEFNEPYGTPVDNTKWTDDAGGHQSNGELEYYSNVTDPASPGYTTANAYQDGNGNLVIAALAQVTPNATCNGVAPYPCLYTSARIKTLGKFSQEFGRFEARIKVPSGKGLWPAFWMLCSNIAIVQWNHCSELDIMEAYGGVPGYPTQIFGSAYGYDPSWSSSNSYQLPSGNIWDDYHVYAVNWQPGKIDYYVDDTLYASVSQPATFDTPMYMILNLAITPGWPGPPDASTFPGYMLVDYVRVYK